MFNLGKQKNIENYKKCLLLEEKYKTIEGVIKYHQDFLNASKVSPVDYWQCLISNYEKESQNEKFSNQEREIFKMTLNELNQLQNDYDAYYLNLERKKNLEKKLSSDDIEQAKKDVYNLLNQDTKTGGQK